MTVENVSAPAQLSERTLWQQDATGAAPNADPNTLGAPADAGFDCKKYLGVSVRVYADQATSGAGDYVTVVPWFYGDVADDPDGGVLTKSWTRGAPVRVPTDRTGNAGHYIAVDLAATAERLYIQLAPSNPALAFVDADVILGVERNGVTAVAGNWITQQELITALVNVLYSLGPIPVDTELTLDGATLNINNLFTASTDGAATGATWAKLNAGQQAEIDLMQVGGGAVDLGGEAAANSIPVVESSDGPAMTRLGTNGAAADSAGSQAAQLRAISNDVRGAVTVIQACDDNTEFAALGAGTANLADSAEHIWGTVAVEFDKQAGATYAAVDDTITAVDLSALGPKDVLSWGLHLAQLTDVEHAFLRLGTDNANYTEWQIPALDLNENWNVCEVQIGNPVGSTGNGWDPSTVTYVAIGVEFNAAGDTLNNITVDQIRAISAPTSPDPDLRLAAERLAQLPCPRYNYSSPMNGGVTYAGAMTLTCAGWPFDIDDLNCVVMFVDVFPKTGGVRRYNNGMSSVRLSAAANTVTIEGAGAVPFDASDLGYVLGVLGEEKGYDSVGQSYQVSEQRPAHTWGPNGPFDLTTAAQNVTAAWADLGAEIQLGGYNRLGLWLTIDINDAQDFQVRVLPKHTQAGAEEYTDVIETVAPSVVRVEPAYTEFNVDADGLYFIPLKINNLWPYGQVQIRANVAGATPGQIDASYITLAYDQG